MNNNTIARQFRNIVSMDRTMFIEWVLGEMDDDIIIDLWNEEYCGSHADEEIYSLDEDTINEQFDNMSAWDIMVKFQGTDFNPNDRYFYYDGYANPCSTNDIFSVISISDLADYLMRNEAFEMFEEWEDEIMYAFMHFGPDLSELTDEEIGDINATDLIHNEWEDIVRDIIESR